MQVADELSAAESAPAVDDAAACSAVANNASTAAQCSKAAAASAMDVGGGSNPAGGSQSVGGVHHAAAEAFSDDVPLVEAAAPVGNDAAPETSPAGAKEARPGDGAAPTPSPALQPASSEEVAVALLDSIVGGELGKLDPVSLDTVPPQVSSPLAHH